MNSITHSKRGLLLGIVVGFGVLAASATLAFAADTTPPSVPTGLTATPVSSFQINLAWNNSTDDTAVAGYTVFRNGTQIATTSVTSYADGGLTAGTTYTYTINAFDTSGNLSVQSAGVSTSTLDDTTAPSIPTGLSATAVSASQINLSWSASADNVGVTGYDVYRNGVQIGTTAATSYSDTGLSASTNYVYTVAAYDAAANVSSQSSSANATTLASGTTAPSTIVVPPTIQIGSDGSVLIHGLTVTSVGTNTFTGTIWGITYTVNYTTATTGGNGNGNNGRFQFLLRGGNSATLNASQIQVGDQIGIQGTVTQSAPLVIQAQIVRNYSITNPRQDKNQNQNHSYSGNGNASTTNGNNGQNVTDLQNMLQQLLGRFRNLQQLRGGR